MKKFIFLLIIFIYSNSFSQWARVNAGVEGGIIFTVYAVPSSNTVFCGSNGNGVFKSTNAGDNWFPVNNGISNYGFYPVTFTSTPGGTVFMGANYSSINGGGMYRTTNGGTEWQKINTGLAGLSLSINMAITANSNIIIATDSGIFRTTNNGDNWNNISGNMGSNTSVESIFFANDTLIAGTKSGLFFSTGSFSNWTSINTGLPAASAPYSINKFNNKIYLVYFGGGLYVSSNNGASWSSANYNLTGTQLNARCLYVFENNLYLSGNGGVYILGNNTWTNMNTGLPTDFPFFYWLTSVPGKLITCTYGKAMYVTTNSGTSWNQKISGLTASALQANKIINVSSVLYSATGNGGIHKSTDGGANWFAVNNGINTSCNNVQFFENKIYASTRNGVYVTSNGGSNWTPLNNTVQPADSMTYAVYKEGNLILRCTYNGVLKSTDDGQSWVRTSLYAFQKQAVCIVKTQGVVFVGTDANSPNFFKSTDDGNTWTSVAYYSFQIGVADIFVDGTSIYIGTGHGVHKTTNLGANWTPLLNGLGADPYVSSIIKIGTSMFCTQQFGGRGLYRTTNDGALWEEVTGELPFFSDFRDVINVNEKVMIATGSGIFSRPESQLTNVQSNLSTMPDKFSLEQNYPNPFNPVTSIKFSVKQNLFVSLNVYDISGKLVSELVNGFKLTGEYNVSFNAAGLPSGIYFYELKAGDFSETKKMILIK